MAIIDPTKLKEPLLATSVKVSTQGGSLSLPPDSFLPVDFLDCYKEAQGRTSFAMDIDSDYSEALREIKRLKTELIRNPKIIPDGKDLLIPTSFVEEFVELVRAFGVQVEGILNVFDPPRIVTIREEFQDRVASSIEVSMVSLRYTSNMSSTTINEAATSAAAVFVAQSFPDNSAFSTGSVDYSYPTPKVLPIPAGISEALHDELVAKQAGTLTRVYSLLSGMYNDVENRAVAGLFHVIDPSIEYLDSTLIEKVEAARNAAKAEKELDDAGVPIPKKTGSNLTYQFGVRTANKIISGGQILLDNFTNSLEIDMLPDTNVPIMTANLVKFIACAKEWIKDQKVAKNIQASLAVKEELELAEDDDTDTIEEIVTVPVMSVSLDVSLGEDSVEDDEIIVVSTVTAVSPLILSDDDEPNIEFDDEIITVAAPIAETQTGTRRKIQPVKRRAA